MSCAHTHTLTSLLIYCTSLWMEFYSKQFKVHHEDDARMLLTKWGESCFEFSCLFAFVCVDALAVACLANLFLFVHFFLIKDRC